ncbi:indole-3-glycerol-phosphate synthase [Corynebacterium pacaense]|uniref:indole-3-glycerol-phosphate synthase n=1 Tax=Corynebacterium pacaense TaxID=1816684 RepID=UPI001FE456DD|nr:indole-3-glycerol-phosphate synthase [Corynebacterium pacaense]
MTVENRLLADVAAEVAGREALVTFQEVKSASRSPHLESPSDVRSMLLASGCGVITAFDRFASDWRDHNDPGDFASQVEDSGALLLSYTIRRAHFADGVRDLKYIREVCGLPLLLHDLIIDPYQIHEARVLGADALVLAVWAMDQAKLESLLDRIESLGMTALVEVHNPQEARRAVDAGASVLAIDVTGYRGEMTLPEAFGGICRQLPREVLRVAMGGCFTAKELMRFAGHGADAVYLPHTDVATTRTLATAGSHPACPSR